MKLRARLLATGLLLGLPLALTAGWATSHMRGQAAEEALLQHALAVAEASRASCEADPTVWGGGAIGTPQRAPGRGALIVFAYREDLKSDNPAAPALPPSLVEKARAGQERAFVQVASRKASALVRTPWGAGPCAFLLVERTFPLGAPLPGRALMFLVPLACALFVIAGMILLLGPVVNRIRTLQKEVSSAPNNKYSVHVTKTGDDEISDLANAFDAAAREIATHIEAREQRDRTFREFVASTTHDIMAPLTVLAGHLSTIGQRARDGQPAEVGLLRAATSELEYLTSLVHNQGASAKLDAGEPALSMASIDLRALVSRTVARQAALARELSVTIEHSVPEGPLWAECDVTLVEQAVGNLAQNAVRYNRPGGHVAVVLEMSHQDVFHLTVNDDGPGIPAEELSRLKERGARGSEARTRHPHGQGLGLSIVVRVVAAHGWALDLEPGEEGGLCARIRGKVGATSANSAPKPLAPRRT